jgi:hypothetical protein
MFIGHFGLGLAAKAAAPRASLGTWSDDLAVRRLGRVVRPPPKRGILVAARGAARLRARCRGTGNPQHLTWVMPA